MERLSDFVASVTRSLCEEHDVAVGEEFCSLAVGVGFLRDAMEEGEAKETDNKEDEDKDEDEDENEDGGEGEAAKKERAGDKGECEPAEEEKAEKDDIMAIAWRVEYDLTRYIE